MTDKKKCPFCGAKQDTDFSLAQQADLLRQPLEVLQVGCSICSNCGRTSCNGIDCYYKEDEPIDELTQAHARIKELEGLVREMGEILRFYGVADKSRETHEILHRPQVRVILDKTI